MRFYQKDIKTLKLLYSHADDTNNDFWRKGSGNNRYVDATCFVSENYYADKVWNQYVNDAQIRSFYVANEVAESNDGRSVYAKAAYGLQQYNIQTFYNRELSDTIVAYGCETINDEEGLGFTANGTGTQCDVLTDTDLIKGTYCRTKFSNMKFRKSWTYTTVFTMNEHWNMVGSIRCIKVKK